MSVRRLATEQPASFSFTAENSAWARQQLLKFPEGKQASAVIPILWRVQEQEGWVSEPAIRFVGEFLSMPYIRVLEVATFYTMYRLAPVGRKAHIQVCGTTPCMLQGAGKLIDICRERIDHEQFHISADGNLSWEEVECLGACVNAPMIQIVPDTYEDLTADSFNKIIDDIVADRPLKPGPQIDRFYSSPVTGFTTLTSSELYDGSMIGQGVGLAAARDAIAARAAAPAPAAAAPSNAAPPAAAPPNAAPSAPAPSAPPQPTPVSPPPAAQPAPTPSSGPASSPATPDVKAQGEADRDKVPEVVKQDAPASDPAVRPDRGKNQ